MTLQAENTLIHCLILFIKPTFIFNDFNHVGQLLCDFASPRLSKDNWSFFKVSCWLAIGGRYGSKPEASDGAADHYQ